MFLSFVLMVSISWLSLPGSFAVVCRQGYAQLGTTYVCYKFYVEQKSWNEAKSTCEANEGYLIILDSDSVFSAAKALGYQAWVGATDASAEGIWKWLNGQGVSRNYWGHDEPNSAGGNEDCAHLYGTLSYNLNDFPCDRVQPFICQGCSNIDNCARLRCNPGSTSYCYKCNYNNYFFKKWSSDTSCERMCAWNNHYCWPGTCSYGLTKYCSCSEGFRKVSTSSETSCQLKEMPTLETCNTRSVGPNGEMKMAVSSGNTIECQYLEDYYANFSPDQFRCELFVSFHVNISLFPSKPTFIESYNFGVADVMVEIVHQPMSGSERTVQTTRVLEDNTNSKDVEAIFHHSANISVPSLQMQNGDRLCLRYTAKGGGYLISIDTSKSNRPLSSPKAYQKTMTSRTICHRFDNVAPVHCLQDKTCESEPLVLETRITKDPNIDVSFEGWKDPVPFGQQTSYASSIESYQITVNEVSGHDTLMVSTGIIFTKKLSNGETRLKLNITSDNPTLYCVTLEVKDIADNVRQARRFFLYDNVTALNLNDAKSFYISSASADTNYLWQTHYGEVCLNWTDHFYKQFYLFNPLLNKIEPDHHGLIDGIYEQNTGVLPVSGTQNVHGIVGYMFSYARNDEPFSKNIQVPDFPSQHFCKSVTPKDGDTFVFNIIATDIVNNTQKENRTLYIDNSKPVITNVWLVKDNVKKLFVHDETDLSKMELQFDAYDQHSGIKMVEWSLGVLDTADIIHGENIGVSNVAEVNCTYAADCYCPVIGNECELLRYLVPLNRLVAENKHQGHHNGIYFFTIKVINNAGLTNTETVEVLVDDSPPEPGVIQEGPADSLDIDYTSDDSLLVHWHGFIDHESGIKLYRLGLANRCLSTSELYNITSFGTDTVFKEVLWPENTLRFPANFTGTHYVTVIALNNAMNPSEAVCSDGITKDISIPEIRNIFISNARWSESIYCRANKTWVLRYDLNRIHLPIICEDSCESSLPNAFVESLPVLTDDAAVISNDATAILNDTHYEFNCSLYPNYYDSNTIYLPNDQLIIRWESYEDSSQIEDFYIGFGTHISQTSAPDLVEYMATDKKTTFRISHAGIGSDEKFYLFLKAVNKAHLENIIPVGPIMIDQTPPRYKRMPDIVIDKHYVTLGWHADTFYDEEQDTGLDSLDYQIGYLNKTVTSIMKWRRQQSQSCKEFTGGCIKYSLLKLQEQDNDNGLDFYFLLHVFNTAGHFTSIKTNLFQLPPRYPPGTTNVIDIDPANADRQSTYGRGDDVDYHFSNKTICAAWTNLTHHGNFQIEFAIGLSKGLDDIYKFTNISSKSMHCVQSELIPNNVKVYASIKVMVSAISTVSSTDGVVIYDSIMEGMRIFDGVDCFNRNRLINDIIINSTVETNLTLSITETLFIGRAYTLRIHGRNMTLETVAIYSPGAVIYKMYLGVEYVDFLFQSAVQSPNFTLSTKKEKSLYVSKLALYNCINDISIQTNTESLDAHWQGEINHVVYEIAGVELSCADTSRDTCINVLSPFRKVTGYSGVIKGLSLLVGHKYFVGIRACSAFECSLVKLSSGVEIEDQMLTLTLNMADMSLQDHNCSAVHIELENSKILSNSHFFKWAIISTSSPGQTTVLTEWKMIPVKNLSADNVSLFQVNDCVNLPVHIFKPMSTCIRVYSVTGTEVETCRQLDNSTGYNSYTNAVYEVDVNSESWQSIREMLHSKHLGESLQELHDSDLDFAGPEARIAGVILYGSGRNITWNLMTEKRGSAKCLEDFGCHYSTITSTGFAEIPHIKMIRNQIYYICASAEETVIDREKFTETLPAISMCSNGFVIDSEPPGGGRIYIRNNNGYINDLKNIDIWWDEFFDNVDPSLLGYQSSIKSYSIHVGSTPFSRDYFSMSDIRNTRTVQIRDLVVNDGLGLYVSVIGFDHVGLSTRVSSDELFVDTSPPTIGFIDLDAPHSLWLSESKMQLQMRNFKDGESGIDYFVVFMGTTPYTDDVIGEIISESDTVELTLPSELTRDGQFYFVGTQAVNRAGLPSAIASLMFGIDSSPPTGGHVLDGVHMDQADVDVQANVNFIAGHWRGFADIHSGIASYRVGLGTKPFEFDTEPQINVGLRTEIFWNSTFVPGQIYFVSVEACNGANLCTSRSSDGIILDDSPPVPGVVRVGFDDFHQSYIPLNSSVEIFWTGFEDPQSGIDHYEVCIGTVPNKCDIEPPFTTLLATRTIKSGLQLLENADLYVTVTAYNKARLTASVSSNRFKVDISPPKVLINPTFVADRYSSYNILTLVDRSVLKLRWKFIDTESPIMKHVVTLDTHHEGHMPVEQAELGNVNEFVINLNEKNWLHNGDKYRAVVTCCNAAGLCTSAETTEVLIDATPPHLGGIKQPLTWQNHIVSGSTVVLTWYGFHDQESGISNYFVGVGRSYSGNDLSSGLVKIDINHTEFDTVNTSIQLREKLSFDDKVVVSVIAENNAGLFSPVARVTLVALANTFVGNNETASGEFEIEKHSCDIHYCNKDCTCAVQGKPCTNVETNLTCNDVCVDSAVSFNISLDVTGGLADHPYQITTSSSCLSAHWNITNGETFIKRFEWSMGMKDHPYGEGIFDLSQDRLWSDIGLRREITYCLPPTKGLIHEAEYIVYVRAWVEVDTYVTFESLPIMIDHSPPAIRKGKYLKDTDAIGARDFDFIDWKDNISVVWPGVFYEPQGRITQYLVGLGTLPGADDVSAFVNVGLETRYDVFDQNLAHGHHYFFTVTAYNNIGLSTTLSSDGFVVDLDIPVAGVVYNSRRHRNAAAQSSTTSFELSWHGFVDLDSGIKQYFAALLEESETQNYIVNFTDCGFRNTHVFRNLSLVHGKRYYGAVKAIDAANHESKIAYSQTKLVDNTAPFVYSCADKQEIYSFSGNQTLSSELKFQIPMTFHAVYLVSGRLSSADRVLVVNIVISERRGHSVPVEEMHDGRVSFNYLFLSDLDGVQEVTISSDLPLAKFMEVSMTKCIVNTHTESEDALKVMQISSQRFKASVRTIDPESNVKTVLLGAGTTPSGFQLKALHPVDVSSDITLTLDVSHKTPVFMTAIAENYAGLRSVFRSQKIVADHTPPVLENITANLDTVNLSTLSTEIVVRINATWDMLEDESGIQICYASVGHEPYSDDIQAPQATSDNRFSSEDLILHHGVEVYVTVKCVNNVELDTKNHSNKIVISFSAPHTENAEVHFIPISPNVLSTMQGYVSNGNVVQTNSSILQFYWDGFEDISGLDHYEYRLLSDNIQLVDWTDAGQRNHITAANLTLVSGQMYTVDVRAVNIGRVFSPPVNSTILIENGPPKLTGQAAVISVSNRWVTVNWEPVFDTNPALPAMFDVFIGSTPGFADLQDKQFVTENTVTFLVPVTSIVTANITELFISISSYYPVELRSLYTTHFIMP